MKKLKPEAAKGNREVIIINFNFSEKAKRVVLSDRAWSLFKELYTLFLGSK
jgi:hypothetical protein